MKSYQFPMEATMYATKAPRTDAQGNPDPSDVQARAALRNILVAQAAGATTNALLDQFEPAQRKRDEEKDFGDRFRDVTRAVVNTAVPLVSVAQMFGSLRNPAASAYEKTSAATEAAGAVTNLLQGSGGVNTQKQDLGGPQPAGPADNAYTQASEQELQRRGAEDYVQKSLFPQDMGQSQQPLTGNQDSLINRQRRAIEDTRLARSERMPGVMRDLNQQVDADMAERLAGLQREAAQYPKTTEIDYKQQGLEAGRQYLENQAAQVVKAPVVSTPKGTSYTGLTTTSTNPLLSREPASSFAEEYGLSSTEKMERAARKAEDAESLADFYASIPADPETGERKIDSFLVNYNEGRGAVEPRNSGELLADQLKGQTAFNQQESREPFIQEQAAEAINALDEQGPGFTSGSIADIFTQGARELAQSDARLYRNVGERLGKMKQNLSEFATEGETATPTQSQKQLSAAKAEAQKDDYLKEALSYLGKAQADTQRQLMEMKNQTVVPTADTNPEYVMSDFLVPAPKARAVPEPSKTVTAPEQPVVKKTTIIEEVETPQQSMKPMDVAERLRRIQTSGRPNARQEAQDFLASIKGQMTNG